MFFFPVLFKSVIIIIIIIIFSFRPSVPTQHLE